MISPHPQESMLSNIQDGEDLEKTEKRPAIRKSLLQQHVVKESDTSQAAPFQRPLFREKAMQQYMQQREKDILPRFGSPSVFRRRVPPLTQMSAVECGAACLAMILSYYGRKTSIAEIRERQGVGRDGLSALNIAQAARNYGLRVRALSLPTSDLRRVRLPAIIHWGFNHFMVVEHWSPRSIDIVDPASGRKRMTPDEFDLGFTGVVLMLEPGAHFDRHTRPPLLTLRTYVLQYIKQAPGTFLQLLVASLLLQVFGLAVPILTKVIVDQIIPPGLTDTLRLLGIGMLIVLLARLAVTVLRASLLAYLEAHIDIQITSSFFEHLLSLPQRFFQQRSSGDILARVASNRTIRSLVCNSLIPAFLDGTLVIVYLMILFSQSWMFGVIVLVIGLLQVLLLFVTHRPIRRLAARELEARGKSQGYVTEMLTGITTLKAAGAEQHAFQRWSNLFLDQLNISVRQNYVTSIIDTFIDTLSMLAPLILLWVGAIAVINGSMQLGTMLALNALGASFLVPLTALISDGQLLQVVRSHFERIADVIEAEPEQDVQMAQLPPRLTGCITVEQVSFQYDANTPKVLKEIAAHIEPGQRIAIVGRTGSGKTTLGRLLLGLYLPTEGTILYDGIPLHRLDYRAVRAQFGVVVQNSHIFSGSIRQNIALNEPSMNLERIITAARLAALHDDIIQMPMGYETFVGEGGSVLSGGQCQRLALARALAHEPAILLLDEATSSLDVATEQIVERNLKALSCTQIIIAHRLSTIRHADCILVLDQGKIIEKGSHQELLKQNGYYAALIQSQLVIEK